MFLIAITWPTGIFDIIFTVFMFLICGYIWGNFMYTVFLYIQKKKNRQADVEHSTHGILVLKIRSLKKCLVVGSLGGGTFLAIFLIILFWSKINHPLKIIVLIAACYGYGLVLGYSRYLYQRIANKYYEEQTNAVDQTQTE